MVVSIDGKKLNLGEIISVMKGGAVVELTDCACSAVQKSRDYIDRKLSQGAVVYGVTTGFGKFSDAYISKEEAAELQRNLILSHACALGDPLPENTVRAAMLLRCNALCRGNSGIKPETLNTLIDMLNKRVHPVIPEKGSLGASGDLAPLSHMVLPMIGEGRAQYQGETLPGGEAMKRAGIPTIELGAKEGLALINGTQIMTAIGVDVLWGAMSLAKLADIAAAMTAEALSGVTAAFDEKVQLLRNQKGQKQTAHNLRRLLSGSGSAKYVNPIKVQDPYSLRCVPQIHGASRDAIGYVYDVICREINAVTDNPLIFPDEDEIISGGNFHGQPIALAMDFLKIALAEYANVSERRIERLVNPQLSEGLPAFLTTRGGICSGFMITQYSAASMVSENKIYAHPASVDSIPSSANQEDHVSMGTTAARTAALILDNAQKVLGIELFAASQAIWLRGEKGLAAATQAAYDRIRSTVAPLSDDIVMHDEMVKFDAMVKDGSIVSAVEKAIGGLH